MTVHVLLEYFLQTAGGGIQMSDLCFIPQWKSECDGKTKHSRTKSSDVAARERRETGNRLDYMLLLCLSFISFNINIFLIIAFNCYSVQLTGY